MTGQVTGVVTRLENYLQEDCPLLLIWCGAHQLDLAMELIMTRVAGNARLFNVMLRIIAYLGRQQTLIVDMCTTRPRAVSWPLAVNKKVTN
jgi:hypothetical protein